jgi:predicted metalloprotease
MRWQGRRESDNVEDRRSDGGGGSMGGPASVTQREGRYHSADCGAGCGLLRRRSHRFNDRSAAATAAHSQRSISPNEDEAAKFTSVILATTEDTWGQLFEKMGRTYQQPKLVMYRGATRTGCGTGQSVMGPFYCPADSTVYIDLSFYDDMKRKLGADGDFAQGYVIAHEVGHHVQKLLGLSRKCASCSKMRLRLK